MEPEKDGWSWAAILVAIVAMLVWAISIVAHSGSAWVPWIAGAVFVLALGTVGVRSWCRAGEAVYTEEQIDAVRFRYRRLSLEMIWSIPLPVGLLLSIGLVKAEILPQWAGAVLVLLSWAAALGLRFVIRSSKAWKDLS